MLGGRNGGNRADRHNEGGFPRHRLVVNFDDQQNRHRLRRQEMAGRTILVVRGRSVVVVLTVVVVPTVTLVRRVAVARAARVIAVIVQRTGKNHGQQVVGYQE